jgi:molybdate transport system ATP-binding protein
MNGGLRAAVRLARSTFTLDVDIEVAPGETVAVLGPNGAGKSTFLSIVAGLLLPDEGRVEIAGAMVDDVAAGVHVPPERRAVGVVFQDHLLFPHLSALDNVAFGLRSRGMAKTEARQRAGLWLERLGVAERAGARPRSLSGGEAQRVALARSLAIEPDLLLLDEPLSALDVETRDRVRGELRTHLAGFAGPRVVVTHDPVEAMVLADRMVVLESGRVSHDGTPGELTRHPRTHYVARLVGLNLYRGQASGSILEVDGGGRVVAAPDEPVDGPAAATVRPQAVSLHLHEPEGTPRNVWSGRVIGVDATGERVRVEVQSEPPVVAEITPAALADLRLASGDQVWVSIKATDVHLEPA